MPRAWTEREAIEELQGTINALADRVQRSVLSEGDVERIVQDVMGGQRRVAHTRQGFTPGDDTSSVASHVAPNTLFDLGAVNRQQLARGGRDRVYEIQSGYPAKVAAELGCSEEAVRQRQTVTDTLAIASVLSGREPDELDYYRDAYEPTVQAIDTATTAEGTEWVPRALSGQLVERVNLNLLVGALFDQVEMPSPVFDIPGVAVSRQRTGTKAEETADTGQGKFAVITPATRKITLTAKKLGVRVIVSREEEEDAIIAMVPFISQEIVDYLSADIEDAIINGDDVAAHQDSDVTDYTDPQDVRTVWNGLRFLTQAAQKTDAANAALTAAMLRTNRSKMGKYGARSDQLAHIIGVKSYVSLLADVNVLTIDKYGPNAPILTGELAKVDGVPIVLSEYVRQDLNATGVFDNVTTNRSLALTVNRRGFLLGQRRGITLQVLRELYAESDQDAIVASLRKAFSARFPTTEGIVALTFNLA